MPASDRHARVPIPRRLRRTRRGDVPAGPGAVASEPFDAVAPTAAARVDVPVDVPVDVHLALTRPEVEALVREVHSPALPGHAGPATPDRLRSAVEAALGPDLADGSVLVARLPRALHSSESWHVRLISVAPAGRDRITQAIRRARLAVPASPDERGDVR